MALRRLALVTACAWLTGLGGAAAATYRVTNANDNGGGSLRQAIADANATPGDDIIEFDACVFATPRTITLAAGSLIVTANGALTINGPAADRLTLAGVAPENAFRQVFIIATGANVVLNRVTITGGTGGPYDLNGGGDGVNGGGIWNGGTLTVRSAVIRDNNQGFIRRGGGIYNAGTLTVVGSTITNNEAVDGGAVESTGSATIIDSTISGNAVSGYAGGIGTEGPLLVTGTTISGNAAFFGGGAIFNRGGATTVVNSTISGNWVPADPLDRRLGGGIWGEFGTVTVIASTITDNERYHPGVSSGLVFGTFTVRNSIVDSVSDDTVVWQGNNLLAQNAALGPLAWNGGPTQTHAPLAGSAAIDGGSTVDNVDGGGRPLTADQRGTCYRRVSGGTVDIGAYERQDANGDGTEDTVDCPPPPPDPGPLDPDGDGIRNACDPDDDNDGVADGQDALPYDPTESVDSDHDGIGNNADLDDDNDGVPDALDALPLNPSESVDSDGDGIGNNSDVDDDGDGVADTADNCPLAANANQADTDHDGLGNVCDPRPNGTVEIVFVSTRDSVSWWQPNFEIYGMRADGSGVVRLTTHAAADLFPALSPDRRRILFTSTRENNRTEIFVMNVDGTNVRRLTSNSTIDGLAVWSPDGQRIAFTSTRDGNAEIYAMNADGTNVVRLTRDAKTDVNPAWSPDGTRIAFASNRNNGNYEIYTVKPDGSALTRLTTQKGDDAFPTWSPDSTRLAFTSTRDGNLEIYVMNANGSGQTRATTHSAIDAEPAWGATNRIVFTSTRGGNSKIYAIDANGGALVPLTNNAGGYDLSPDW